MHGETILSLLITSSGKEPSEALYAILPRPVNRYYQSISDMLVILMLTQQVSVETTRSGGSCDPP
jgi:hypothetical protein